MSDHISQEDEDVKRAIADDWSKRTDFTGVPLIGQIPGKIFVNFSADEHTGKTYDCISIPNARICPWSPPKKVIWYKEPFEAQPPVTYDEAVDMLFNINCCFGLYDKKIKQWRTAIYMKKWDHKKRLMVRFKPVTKQYNKSGSDTFLTINFPVNYIILDDNKRFTISERALRDMSNVPKENIDKWVKKKSIQRKQQQCKILVAGFIKDQEKKQQISRGFPGLQLIIAHYCCLLIYGLPIISNWKTIIIIQNIHLFKANVWNKRTDFTGVKLISYLCDDGEVIKGDLLRQRPGKIFVHFTTTYAGHYDKEYDWIPIPNERICPPLENTHSVTKKSDFWDIVY